MLGNDEIQLGSFIGKLMSVVRKLEDAHLMVKKTSYDHTNLVREQVFFVCRQYFDAGKQAGEARNQGLETRHVARRMCRQAHA